MKSKIPYPRTLIAALSVSAAGLIAVATDEGYREMPYIPIPGDVLTDGFGNTKNVKPGVKTNPVRALIQLGDHVGEAEQTLRQCLGDVKLYNHEWDAYVRLSINVGSWAVCNSSIKTKLQAGQYEEACKTILDFNKFRDSTKPKIIDRKTGKLVYPLVEVPGLTKRRQREFAGCMGVAQ